MTKDQLYEYVFDSAMFKRWHWFRWHFERKRHGNAHPLAESIIDACLDCERHVPGFARAMIDAIASISGREKYLLHWEQLLQRLSELLVVRQVVVYPWREGSIFKWEPTAKGSLKNPELTVETSGATFGIEVKAPAIFEHQKQRARNKTQITSRAIPREQICNLPGIDEGLTLPRDNPIKDFLTSAESKFRSFHQEIGSFFGVLVVVWDDFINEPISALVHSECGLLTDQSFAKNESGDPLRFTSVDGVVAVRHLHQFIAACRDEPLVDHCRHALDYGRLDEFPFKAFLQNPNGRSVPEPICDCLQAYPPTHLMGAEYIPGDLIWSFPST